MKHVFIAGGCLHGLHAKCTSILSTLWTGGAGVMKKQPLVPTYQLLSMYQHAMTATLVTCVISFILSLLLCLATVDEIAGIDQIS